jgi:hypothetical protein
LPPPAPPSPGDSVRDEEPPQQVPEAYLVLLAAFKRHWEGKQLRITSVPFQIGRAEANDFANDPGVSRTHASIDYKDGVFTITDTGSRNGTYLENWCLRPGVSEVLIHGAHIRLSKSTVLIFRLSDALDLPDLTGRLITDRYELIKQIKAGLKACYEARDLQFNRTVALKLFSPGLAQDAAYLQQFR